MFYNFCRVHQTLRVTPAMEAGVSDHVWDLEEIVNLMVTPTPLEMLGIVVWIFTLLAVYVWVLPMLGLKPNPRFFHTLSKKI